MVFKTISRLREEDFCPMSSENGSRVQDHPGSPRRARVEMAAARCATGCVCYGSMGCVQPATSILILDLRALDLKYCKQRLLFFFKFN